MNISQKSDMKSFFDPTVKAISTALELPAAIWLFDEEKKEFRIVCAYDLSDEFIQDAVVSEERAVSVIKEKFEKQKSLIVPDIQNAPFWRRKAEAEKMNLKSAVASTLRIKTQVVGGLVVYIPKDQTADFKKLEIKIESFAEQTVTALYFYQRRKALLEIGNRLASAITQKEYDIFELINDLSKQYLYVRDISIALYYETRREAEFVFAYKEGRCEDVKNNKAWGIRKIEDEESKTIKVIRSKHYWHIPTRNEKKDETLIRTGSWLGVPMIAGNNVLGVIATYNYEQDNFFNDDDITVFQTLADQAAIAIHNMRCYKTEQNQRQYSDILRKTFEKIEITKDRHILCAQIVEQLSEIVKFDFASIELIRDDKILLYAHRGNSYFYSENTGKTFERFNINKDEKIIISNKNDYFRKIILALRNSGKNLIGMLNIICSVEETEKNLDLLKQFANQVSAKLLENDIFLKEKIKALLDIGMKLNVGFQLSEEEIYSLILEHVTEKLGLKNFFIALYDIEHNAIEFKIASSSGRKVSVNSNHGFKNRKFGDEKIENVIMTNEYLLLNSLEELENFGVNIGNKTAKSWLGVPMRFGGKVIGVMGSYHDKENYFENEDVGMLQGIANYFVIAIENIRLKDNRIKSLKSITKLITVSSDIDKISNHILLILNNMMKKGCLSDILLLDNNSNTLKIKWLKGTFAAKDINVQIKIGEGITGWVAEHKEPLYIPNVRKDKRYIEVHRNINSEIAVPLIEGDNLIGVLNVEHDEIEAFTEDDFELSKVIGNIAAIAINNAKLYDRITKDQNLLRTLIDNIPDHVYIKNTDSRFLNANKKMLKSFVLKTVNEIIGKNDFDFFPKKDAEEYFKEEQTVINSDQPICQKEYQKEDKWFLVTKVPFKDEKGKILGIVGINRDITKRKKNREKIDNLVLQQKVLIDLAQNLTSSIQLTEDDIFNIIREKSLGLLMEMNNMFIGLYDEQTDLIHFPLAFKDGKPTKIMEGEERKKSGKKGRTEYIIETKKSMFCETKEQAKEWYKQAGHGEFMGDELASFIGVPMMTGDKVLGVVATYHPTKDYVYSKDDLEILQTMANIAAIALQNARLVTDLRDAQAHIADRESELVKSGLAMDFIHKMNNIAGTISPWISLIKRRLDKTTDPKIFEYLEKVKRDTTLMLKEANDLKNLRPLPGSPYIKEAINMEELTGSIIGQLEMLYPPEIKFNFKYEKNMLQVRGIKDHLSTAIYSIMQNGINAISGKGTMVIHMKNLVQNKEHYVEMHISDTGCGIPKDKINSVFEYGISLWQDKKGTGYGLWRARSIIQSMKGSIQIIRTEPGKGTEFMIRLPAVENSK
ncbi:MAG: GAF domain-containing protein [Desulfococcaceae bacterium]